MEIRIVRLLEFLGADVAALLLEDPFASWSPVRTVADYLPEHEIMYEFEGQGVALRCDADGTIRSIFVVTGSNEALVEVDFSASVEAVRARLGTPEATGGPVDDPVLGRSGAWDRFALARGVVHVQYRDRGSGVQMVTLMRPDVVPGSGPQA